MAQSNLGGGQRAHVASHLISLLAVHVLGSGDAMQRHCHLPGKCDFTSAAQQASFTVYTDPTTLVLLRTT
jgi:hypothetical protein